MEVANYQLIDILYFSILHLELMPEDFDSFLSEEEPVLGLVDSVCIISEDFIQYDVGNCILFSLVL